jgi:hypothetical protein
MGDIKMAVTSRVNMNTFSVYLVHSKRHMLVLSAEFCRGADWSIDNAFMLTPE